MILTAPKINNKNEGMIEVSRRLLHHPGYVKTNLVWNPSIDIFEDANGFKVIIETPGIDAGI